MSDTSRDAFNSAAQEALRELEAGDGAERLRWVVRQPHGGFMRCSWPAEGTRKAFGNPSGRSGWVWAATPPGWSITISDEAVVFLRDKTPVTLPEDDVYLAAMAKALAMMGYARYTAVFQDGWSWAFSSHQGAEMEIVASGVGVVGLRAEQDVSKDGSWAPTWSGGATLVRDTQMLSLGAVSGWTRDQVARGLAAWWAGLLWELRDRSVAVITNR